MTLKGPHDFCREDECGAVLNLRDSFWGNCIRHRDEQRARMRASLESIQAKIDSGAPVSGTPSRRDNDCS